MPPPRKVSMIQLTVLLTYLEKYKNIQLGTAVAKGKIGQKRQEEHWQKIAKILNKCPGTPRTAHKWKHYWNEKKSSCRKKAAENKALLPFEKRIMLLIGPVQKDEHGFTVMNYVKAEPGDDMVEKKTDTVLAEKHGKRNDSESELDDDSRSPPEQVEKQIIIKSTQSFASDGVPAPMPMLEVTANGYDSNYEEERLEDNEEYNINDDSNKPHQNSGEVPEWVRTVEHSRLSLETQTTQAIVKIEDGITSISEAMHSVVSSLKMIEEAIRSSSKKCNCQSTRVYSS